jgi:outer membrane protein assembly factor BamA
LQQVRVFNYNFPAFFFLFFSSNLLYAQNLFYPKISEINGKGGAQDFGLQEGTMYERNTILNNVRIKINALKQEGRIFSSLDTFYQSADTLYLKYYKSEKTDLIFQIAEDVRQDISYLDGKIRADSASISDFHKYVLEFYNERGYPLATSRIKVEGFEDDAARIKHVFDKGPLIVWDTLSVPDSVNIRKSYLSQILNIKENTPFDKKQFDQIKTRMRNLQFLQLKGDPQIKFTYDKASVVLPLANKPASRFDFIIGVLPGNDGNRRVWNINGELTSDWVNKLGLGERISVVLKNLSVEDRLLKIGGNLPFILNTGFGFEGDFEWRNNRNLTVDVLANIGTQYTISNTTRVKAYWNINQSSLINLNKDEILRSKRLPRTLDYTLNGGGLELWYNKLDYIFNPRRGTFLRSGISLGRRNIIKNEEIISLRNESADFKNAYDSITLKNIQLGFEIDFARYIPVGDWAVNKLSLNTGLKYNNDRIVENELYRLGGNRLMRGFDELTLLSNFYAVATAEFRLILDQNSFLSLPFFDFGFLHQDPVNIKPKGVMVMGMGLGMNFSTKAGIFNISFAAGNYDRQGFDFANTKIHFGYVNLF